MAVTIGELQAVLTARTAAFERGMKRAEKSLKPLTDKVDGVSRRLKTLGKAFALVGGAGAAFGIAFTKSVIDAASESENLRLRLNALLGSVEEGGRAFEAMSKFAARVPFEFRDIMASATQLAGIVKGGTKELAELMPLIADLAAVSGLSIQQTTEQIVRAFSAGIGAADLFRERGISAMLGFSAGVAVTGEETKRRILEQFNAIDSKFRGASEDLARTWTGIMSMVSDRWFSFRRLVADAGLFDAAKNALQNFVDRLDELEKSGRLKVIARQVSDAIVATIETAIRGVGRFIEAGTTAISFLAGSVIAQFGLVGLMLLGRKGAATFAILGAGIDQLIGKLTGPTTQVKKIEQNVRRLNSQISRLVELRNEIKETGIIPAGAALTFLQLGVTAKGAANIIAQVDQRIAELTAELKTNTTTLETQGDAMKAQEGPLAAFLDKINLLAAAMKQFTLDTRAAKQESQGLAPSGPTLEARAPGQPPPRITKNPLLDQMEALRKKLELVQDAALALADIVGNAIGNAFARVLTGVESVGSAVVNLGKSILSEIVGALTAAIAKALIFRAILSGFGFKVASVGDLFKGFLGFKHGGVVPGQGPVPAILHGGEAVLSKSMLQSFGSVMADLSLAGRNMRMGAFPATAAAPVGPAATGLIVNPDLTRIPATVTPREVALDGAWQNVLRETLLQLEQGGFRFV